LLSRLVAPVAATCVGAAAISGGVASAFYPTAASIATTAAAAIRGGHPRQGLLARVNGIRLPIAAAMSSSSSSGGDGEKGSGGAASPEGKKSPPPQQRPTSVVPSFSSRVERTLDPCVVLMKRMIGEYAPLWDKDEKGGICSLAQGVVYWNPPATSTDAIKRALDDGVDGAAKLHEYGPDEGLPELRSELERKLREENNLTNHDVMVTAGANQAYVNVVITLLQENRKAVVFAPYYFNHVMALQMTLPAGNESSPSILVGPSSDGGYPDLDWLERQLENDADVHMVTIVNPGNPTGAALPRALLQRAVDLCRQYSCWLILDCVYEYFVVDGLETQRVVNFDGCFPDPHVVHVFSFSKAYALAG